MFQNDYNAIAVILGNFSARSLEIDRSGQPPYSPKFMRFILFEPGLGGSSLAVMGVWFGPRGTPHGNLFRKCMRTKLPDWWVCESI
jgi:hypothetical protein